MAASRLLIIAPELDLRLSLEFLLEAEGHSVASRPRIDPELLASPAPFDCTILDHKAVVGPARRVIEFCERASPVILLSDRPVTWLEPHVGAVVGKLVAARDLPVAIGRLIQAPQSCT